MVEGRARLLPAEKQEVPGRELHLHFPPRLRDRPPAARRCRCGGRRL